MAEVRKMSEFNFNEESNHPNIILRDMRDERNDVKSRQEGESSRQGRARALH